MRHRFTLLLPFLLAACATAGGVLPRERYLITSEEIAPLGLGTAFQVVERLHPEWIRVRGIASLTQRANPGSDNVVVYVDGVRAGDPETLRDVAASAVDNMRFLSASEATNRHGTGHLFGAIEVTTRNAGIR